VKRSFCLGLALMAMWMLWSGHLEPLLLSLGGLSCVSIVWLSRRMRIVDEEGAPIQLGVRPFTQYFPWLVKEIVRANVDVARRIVDPQLPIRPIMVCVKTRQRSALGRVILANSITLTPGTISVNMQGEKIWVHALSSEGADEDLSGEMNRRVAKLEAPR